jgi:DNA invertase Pin-like site-specific DNA recombinase
MVRFRNRSNVGGGDRNIRGPGRLHPPALLSAGHTSCHEGRCCASSRGPDADRACRIRFALYGRVSTEDQQDPKASRGCQLRRARSLIDPHGGTIVDSTSTSGKAGHCRGKRRPEASRLLVDVASADRSFDALAIGEPQRAFYGNQFGLTFPVLTHYGVGLWVPEVGDAVDPGSEADDMVMTLFGGMSKGERSRVQLRVRQRACGSSRSGSLQRTFRRRLPATRPGTVTATQSDGPSVQFARSCPTRPAPATGSGASNRKSSR